MARAFSPRREGAFALSESWGSSPQAGIGPRALALRSRPGMTHLLQALGPGSKASACFLHPGAGLSPPALEQAWEGPCSLTFSVRRSTPEAVAVNAPEESSIAPSALGFAWNVEAGDPLGSRPGLRSVGPLARKPRTSSKLPSDGLAPGVEVPCPFMRIQGGAGLLGNGKGSPVSPGCPWRLRRQTLLAFALWTPSLGRAWLGLSALGERGR